MSIRKMLDNCKRELSKALKARDALTVLRLTRLLTILQKDRIEELEKEIVTIKLKSRYGRRKAA
jgi:hypothetical protein